MIRVNVIIWLITSCEEHNYVKTSGKGTRDFNLIKE
jgi:hypothetical protein